MKSPWSFPYPHSFLFAFLFPFALCFLPSFAISQDTLTRPDIPVDEVTKLITYKQVISEKGTKDEFYVRGIAWLNSNYKNPAEVTRTRDREDGLIKGVHRFKLYYVDKDGVKKEASFCEYDFILECKEGRYRYTLTNFSLKDASRHPIERWLNKEDPAYNPQWDDYLKQVNDFVVNWAKTLQKAMEPPVVRKDEW